MESLGARQKSMRERICKKVPLQRQWHSMEGQPRHTDKEIEWKQGDELSDSGSPVSLAGILRRNTTEARRQGLLCPPHPSPGVQCRGEKQEKGSEGKQTCSDNR